MKSVIRIINEVCEVDDTNVCKLDLKMLSDGTGLDVADTYIELKRLEKLKIISLFEENKTTYIHI